jgi:SM-20-related protein
MSRNKLLQTLGLYVEPGCLTAPECRAVLDKLLSAPREAASVYVTDRTSAVKPETRSASCVDVPEALDRLVRDRLEARRADLGRHFGVPLSRCETPQYLVYETGGFFRPHVDAPPRSTPGDREDAGRRVSVVIFLSTPDAAERGDYGGGELRLFNLVDDPQWRGIGLAGEPKPGLLLAFRSDTIHEVTEVTRGVRCAIAAWFR